jgi:hypothetical protein
VDVVLGVAVTGRVARIAMVGSPADGGQVYDEYALDLPTDAMTELADTIVGTFRAVADSGNRLAATRLCVPDAAQADALRRDLLSAGVRDVEVVEEAEAATALIGGTDADAAVLLVDDDTATLTVAGAHSPATSVLASVPIGAAGAAVACMSVLERAAAQPDAPARVMLVGHASDLESVAAGLRDRAPLPVDLPSDAAFAIACGAAKSVGVVALDPAGPATQMAPPVDLAGPATQLAPAASASDAATGLGAVAGPQLAYSMADPEPYEMPMDPLEEFVPEQDADATEYTPAVTTAAPRMMLMGSAIAFVVVSFATLAVTLAINIRPAALVSEMPTPAIQSDTVPGRYLPAVPHQPDPVALPVAVLTPPPAAPPAPSPQRTNNLPVINNAPAAPRVEQPGAVLLPPSPAELPLAPAVPLPPVPAVPLPPVGIPYLPLPPIATYPSANQFPPPSSAPASVPSSAPSSPPSSAPSSPPSSAPASIPSSAPSSPPSSAPASIPSSAPSSPPSSAPPVVQYSPPSSAPAVAPSAPEPQYIPPAAPAYTPPAAEPTAPAAPAYTAPATTVIVPSQ